MSDPEPTESADDTSQAEATDEVFAEGVQTAANEGADDLRAEIAELNDKLLRSHAELENFRRRTQKEAAESIKYQAMPVIRDFLPGLDNLQRAIDATEQTGDTQSLVDGVKMVAKQFQDVLKAYSAESINPEGASFDPNLHEALTQAPSADHPPMTILQVVETGYRIHDRVIRPAKVIVSCAPPEPAPEVTEESSNENEE